MPDLTADVPILRLTFQVSGQLELGKEKVPEFGLIEHVVSPGRTASQRSVDVEVKVD